MLGYFKDLNKSFAYFPLNKYMISSESYILKFDPEKIPSCVH